MKKGWETKKLGEVCEIIKGHKPALKAILSDGDLPYLVAKVLRGSEEAEYASVGDRNSITVTESETIIICDGSNSGEIFTGFHGILSSTMGKIAKKTDIDDRYLRAVLASTFEIFNGAKTGAAIPHLDKEAMYQLRFPLPPLPEQRRIVGILDEAFEGIVTAKANAEKNLQNARELFESHLQSVFTHRGEGWVEKKLGDVCEVKDGTHDSPKYVANGIPFITQKNIREDGLSFAKTKFISQDDHKDFYRRSNVAHKDILISMIGANRGMACIVDDERVFSIKNVGLVKQNGAINQQFLLYFLKSSQAANYVQSESKGGAQEFIGLTELRKFPIPFPELDRQNTLVAKFDALSTETKRLESIYQQKLAAFEALKKSLLHQAFNGEL
jgi:type I restriction enzyme S subunit